MVRKMWVADELKPRTQKAKMCVVEKREDDGSFWMVSGIWVPNSARVWIKTPTKNDAFREEETEEIESWMWPKIEETIENNPKKQWRQG